MSPSHVVDVTSNESEKEVTTFVDTLPSDQNHSDDEMTDQGLLIEKIRIANGEGENSRTKATLGRALEKISTELYSKDTHFLLELLQNADDNEYTAGLIPTIEFTLSQRWVLVRNNENGFREKDIWSICDVGMITKKKKGIE